MLYRFGEVADQRQGVAPTRIFVGITLGESRDVPKRDLLRHEGEDVSHDVALLAKSWHMARRLPAQRRGLERLREEIGLPEMRELAHARVRGFPTSTGNRRA